jgi:GNAT superfamily N-acetyltransferase
LSSITVGTYSIRAALSSDRDVICDHRRRMFDEIGQPMDTTAQTAFESWLDRAFVSELYKGWFVVSTQGTIVAGAGLTIVPWPPGPNDKGDHVAFVYNVFTEPHHRQRGLARQLMNHIHTWCRGRHIRTVRLHASLRGRPLYEALGYAATNEMALRLPAEGTIKTG